jgi:hypothetical protein
VVTDKDGTIYSFPGGFSTYSPGTMVSPDFIEDRNGNEITFPLNQPSYVDTLGRPGPTVTSNPVNALTGINTPPSAALALTVDNLNYSATWSTVSVNYQVATQLSRMTGMGCTAMPTAVTGTRSVLSSLTLPNGQSYTFYYGNNNPTDSTILNSYGLLNEIIYPDGGWVKVSVRSYHLAS